MRLLKFFVSDILYYLILIYLTSFESYQKFLQSLAAVILRIYILIKMKLTKATTQ